MHRLHGACQDITAAQAGGGGAGARATTCWPIWRRLVPGVVYQYRLYPDGSSAFPYSSPGMNDIYEVTPEEVREDATPVFGTAAPGRPRPGVGRHHAVRPHPRDVLLRVPRRPAAPGPALALVAGPPGAHRGRRDALARHHLGHHRAQAGRGGDPPAGRAPAAHGRGRRAGHEPRGRDPRPLHRRATSAASPSWPWPSPPSWACRRRARGPAPRRRSSTTSARSPCPPRSSPSRGVSADVEFNLIRQHPAAGYDILAAIDFGSPVAEIVLQHHERLDGSGYPQGLAGDADPAARRASSPWPTSSRRCRRTARTAPPSGWRRRSTEVRAHAGVRYDPDVVAACLRLFGEQGFTFTP